MYSIYDDVSHFNYFIVLHKMTRFSSFWQFFGRMRKSLSRGRSHTRRRNSKYRDINPKNVVSITTLESLKSHSFFDNCVEKKETRFDRRIGNTCNINTSSTSVPSLITKPSIMGKSSTQKPLFTAPKRHRHTLYGTLLCVIWYCFLTRRVVIYDDDVDYHL